MWLTSHHGTRVWLSVRFVEEFLRAHTDLTVLVNNAGLNTIGMADAVSGVCVFVCVRW